MQKTKRILALLLVAALTVTQLPVIALATSTGEGGEIIAFDTLPEETANQTVTLGTSLEDLNLPNTLNATVRVVAEDTEASGPEAGNEPVQDSGEPQQPEEPSDPVADVASGGEGEPQPDKGQPELEVDGEQAEPEPDKPEQAPAEPEMMEMDIPVPVEWISAPDYDGEKAGTYTFTAQIEGFTVSAAPPSIAVTVGEITGTVTAFDELPDNIRWQNTAEPTFPETVGGTVEGEAVQIPVTWQTEQDYDENTPEHGLYVFDAVPGEGYTLAGGVEAPRVTVFIPETISRFAPFRMGGGGTDTSPLEITTAAQLAEIAVLVNAGKLESFLLNDANATVSLKLMNDLDLSAYGQGYNGGKGWVPIGTADKPFKGHFDGDGHAITGLYINDTALNNAGLFGYLSGGTVEKLILSDASIRGGNETGGIAGRIKDATVKYCGVTGSVNGRADVGGVVGTLFGNGKVEHCYSAGSVGGTVGYVGGIAGSLTTTTSILQNCYSTATVEGNACVGGIAGDVIIGANRVMNCAALNPSVSAAAVECYRVAGKISTNALSGNAAFKGMIVKGSTVTSSDYTHLNGADITAAAIKADGTIGGRFTSANGWTVEDGKLPGFDNAVNMPDYITGGSDPNFPGAGTAANPFLIDTAEQLAKLAELVNAGNNTYGGSNYKLIADIDLSAYGSAFNGGKGWVPIGTQTDDFFGSFDGNGKTITGLYINDPTLENAGLFGCARNGPLGGLALKDVAITAKDYVGALVGASSTAAVRSCFVSGTVSGAGTVGGIAGVCNGTLINCVSTAKVTGTGDYIGGVAGAIFDPAVTFEACYAIGEVSGAKYVGGLVGGSRGTIKNCAALNSKVSGTSVVGRIVGSNSGALSDNVAFDWIVDGSGNQFPSGNSGNINGDDRTADQLQFATSLPGIFGSDPWITADGFLPGLFGKTVEMPAHITTELTNYFAGGDGSQGDPYQITTATQLAKLAELVNAEDLNYNSKYYKLMNDLDLSGYGASNTGFNGGKGWVPIGYCPPGSSTSFKGGFDGNHKTITGLYINDSAKTRMGLFGYIYNGTVKNLGLTNVNITGAQSVGGIAGIMSGKIENCYVSGKVDGTWYVGGIAGSIYGILQNCYSTGSVVGTQYVGGIAGSVNSSLQNCYSTASVITSAYHAGGIAGTVASSGTIKNCAALNPKVSAGAVVGRVAGSVDSGGALAGNRAFSGMIGGGSYKTADGTDGADISAEEINTADFWTTDENWDSTATWVNPAWNFQDGYLPLLKGFGPGAQSGDGGLYLTERDIANAAVNSGGPYTYTGSATEPSLTVTFDGQSLTKDADYTVAVTSTDDSGTSAGINAGMVTLTLTGKGNFKGTKAGVTYTIQPKALTAGMLTVTGGPFTYTGTPHTPDVTVTDGGTALAKDTDYTVGYAGNTNAGTATVTVTGTGNYSGAVSKNFTIEKAIPAALTWPIASAITYGAALSDSSLTGGIGAGTWAWTVGTAVPPAGTVGYEVTFTPADITNYDWSGVTLRQNVSLTVNKASGLTVSTQPSMNARESVTRSYEFDMDNIALNKADTGAKTYSAAEGTDVSGILSNVQVNGSKLTYAISNTAAVGNTATVAITISTANYEDVTATLTVTVTAKDTQTISFAESTVTKTYGDTKFTQTSTLQGVGGTGQITYASDNAAVATVNATTGEVTIVGAGSANITATKAADDDWYAATAAYGLTVNKKTVTITAHDKTAKAGQSQPAYTYAVTGLVPGESLATEPSVTCPNANMSAAGTYPIVPSGAAASANYVIQYQNGTLTVSPLSTACNVVGVASPAGSKISGTSITGAVANSVSSQLIGVTVSTDAAWALYSDIACTTEITNKTMTLSVGANTAYIKVTAEDGITAKIYTVTITRSASTGGGSGGDSSSGGTSGDTTTTTTGKTPDQPVTAAAPVTATAGAGGSASAAIPDKAITDAIAKAQADAKAQGRTANGISVALNVTMPKGSTSLTAILTRNSLNSLVSAGVSQLELGGAPISLGLDLKALQEIQKQSSGDISITIAPATGLSKEAKTLLGNRPVYSITISYVKDGKTVNVTSLGSGTATLSIPYTPGKNEAVGYLFGVYVDAKGKAQRISGSAYDVNSRSLLIPTGHFSVYGVGYTAPSAKFSDIGNHWGKEAIDFVVGRGLLSGTSDTTFAPNTAMTRGMLVTALGKLAGVDTKAYTTNSFTDVKADSDFRPYIEWAYKKGIVQGIGNQQFAPDRAITREEIAVIFANYAKATGYKLPVTREATAYADSSSIGSFYKTAVTAMQQASIMMGGTDNRFNPKSNATRAEVSSMLHRYIKLTIDPATAQGWALNDAGQWLYYKDGKPLTGTQTIDGTKYFFNTDGTLKTGWVKDGDNWRYYSGNKATVGWLDISDKRYYFTKDGLMVSGKWLQIDSKWYYFYADGSLAKSTKVDGYEVGPDGVAVDVCI